MTLKDKMLDVLDTKGMSNTDKLKALNDLVRRIRLPRNRKGVPLWQRLKGALRHGKKDK